MFINEQYPPEIAKRRAVLRPILNIAKSRKMKAFLTYDRLIINGISYTVDNLDQLTIPGDDLARSCMVKTDKYVFFHGRLVPYSNFYKCPIVIGGTTYCCVEQYFQYCKATHANDSNKAAQIMMTSDPYTMKTIGNSVNSPNSWISKQIHVMKLAITEKFLQHTTLRQQLLATGQAGLAEANIHDTYWGIGRGLRSRNLDDKTKWTGKNNMGLILETVRKDLAG